MFLKKVKKAANGGEGGNFTFSDTKQLVSRKQNYLETEVTNFKRSSLTFQELS